MRPLLSLRFAARELRSGVRGFRIFLACLALGVAAIAAAGSTAEAFRQGLSAQAREILGGDLSVSVEQRDFTPAEQAAFARLGRVVYAAGAQAMAQGPAGDRRLVELRGVGLGYPLAGRVGLGGAASLAQALAPGPDGAAGAAVEPALLDRLGLTLGQTFTVGDSRFIARAVLLSEPDRIGRFALGPRVLTSLAAIERTGLLQPGGLYGETARIVLPPGAAPRAATAALRRALPGAGLDIRDRYDAAPGARRLIDRLEYFLGFIGLAALLAGGLGVFGAVSAYLETRKPSIAVLKALGAEGPLIRDVYLIQIGLLAALGVGLGLAVGAAAPLLIGWFARDQLPIPALFALYPLPLVRAGVFGLLAAAAFSLEPLARARATPPASLFRRDLSARAGFGPETAGAVLAGLGLAALTIVSAPTPVTAAAMIGGVAVAMAMLWALGRLAVWLAARGRGGARGAVRLGLANLAGPRSAARTATPAIGLGVALLSAVVLIQSSLLAQVREVAPRTAPAVVFTEIPADRAAAFDAEVSRIMGPLAPDRYLRMPFATGRITALKGAPVDRQAIAPDQRWAFDNDIGLSALAGEPAGAAVTQGHWWPADYAGPPLVALDAQIARAGRLSIGDPITVSILGRDIDARVAALRKVDWGGFGPDFALVVDAHALDGAALRNVALARMSKAQELALTRALGADFPAVNVISVREQLESASALFDRLALAVRGAAAVAALAGLLVLAGSIAAGAQARAREAATLKVLGAARGQILAAYAVEYGAVGLIAGTAGVLLGAAAAWPVVVKVFEARWSVDWAGVGVLLGGAAAVTGAGGLAAALQALSRRPAPVLRSD
ncbi:MAG: FtsX-like permease family protein [Caulobacteraceae bacterium]|nr:FtsX-like permease family protein [Caulobacteraceae bacterium]